MRKKVLCIALALKSQVKQTMSCKAAQHVVKERYSAVDIADTAAIDVDCYGNFRFLGFSFYCRNSGFHFFTHISLRRQHFATALI